MNTNLNQGTTVISAVTPRLRRWVETFITARKAEGKSPGTLNFCTNKITIVLNWAELRNIGTPEDVTADVVRRKRKFHLSTGSGNRGSVALPGAVVHHIPTLTEPDCKWQQKPPCHALGRAHNKAVRKLYRMGRTSLFCFTAFGLAGFSVHPPKPVTTLLGLRLCNEFLNWRNLIVLSKAR